ncbi:MAG TPA: hypothetical protein VIY48_18455 [Candidatus Paceibacterota bacterium]
MIRFLLFMALLLSPGLNMLYGTTYYVSQSGSCTLTLTDLDLDQNGGHQSVSDTVSLNNTGNKLFSIELGVPYQPSGFWVSHYVDEFKEWTQ